MVVHLFACCSFWRDYSFLCMAGSLLSFKSLRIITLSERPSLIPVTLVPSTIFPGLLYFSISLAIWHDVTLCIWCLSLLIQMYDPHGSKFVFVY